MTFWKFRLTRHPKAHLSVEVNGRNGTGDVTLCGLKVSKILGSARTITRLEGDECVRCSELFTENRGLQAGLGVRLTAVATSKLLQPKPVADRARRAVRTSLAS